MNQPARHLRRPDNAARPAPGAPSHLRVVDRREQSVAQRHRRARMLLIGGIGAALAVMFALVYLHVVLAQRQIELDRMSSAAITRQNQYQALRLKVAQLESPQQIIATAEGKLGMRQPASVTYVSPPAGSTAASNPGASTPSGGSSSTPTAGHPSALPGTVVAPAGDADWPKIKAALAGGP